MNQSQIFISYSSKNYQFACKLYDDLLSNRYWVWIDKKNLEAAKEWEPQIDENLRKSKTFIALISSKSVASDWVKHEGSIAFALNQLIIPVRIEPFGTYSASDLPIWTAKIQLLDLIEESPDYYDQFQKLKQLLGEPLPIRQHLKEMLIQYKNFGMLLDEVALALIERHYDELYLTNEEKELADKLIEESRRKLDSYWVRYDKLKKDYENTKQDYENAKNDIEKEKENISKLNRMLESYKIKFNLEFIFWVAFCIFIFIYSVTVLIYVLR